MSQTIASSGAADLPEVLAAKLVLLERDVERLEREKVRRGRWFWLGAIPRLFRWFVVLGLAVQLSGFVMYTIIGMERGPERIVIPAPQLLGAVAYVFSTMLMLLISTWAIRYCQARADGRL